MAEDLLLTLRDKVHPRHAALLIVDVQNDFCADGGLFHRTRWSLSRIQSMVPNLVKFIDEARRVNLPIIFIQNIGDDIYLAPPMRERMKRKGYDSPATISGSWGADFYLVKPEPQDRVVVKHRYSGFYETELDMVLRSLGVKSLIMTGVATNGCVDSTARDGYYRGYYVVMVDDCCGAGNELLQRATLETIDSGFGVVCTAGEIVEIWKSQSRSAMNKS